MSLRCFLFSSDEETAATLRQILAGLELEGEFCANAVSAAERITNQPFQIVIIDWDQQPEAGVLLDTARERKAAERPLTLAIVSKDADGPQALQAGANSLLRKPLVASQAKDTLTTARDLLRAKQMPTGSGVSKASAGSLPAFTVVPDATADATLRAGEFLQTPTLAPGGLFETETTLPVLEESSQPVTPLKDLEPVASSVQESAVPEAAPKLSGTRGLEWYLKNRGPAQNSGGAGAAAAPAPASPAANAPQTGPDLVRFDQIVVPPVAVPSTPSRSEVHTPQAVTKPEFAISEQKRKRQEETSGLADTGKARSSQLPQAGGNSFLKRAIFPALVLAAIAITAAPQAPWHSRLQQLVRRGKQSLQVWLNPQPATPTQAPVAHETFTRPGDEYKLPVAEPIPDATTDPSQIEVVPAVDPTIKKTNPQGGNTIDSSAVPAEGPAQPPDAGSQSAPPQASDASAPAPDPFRPAEHAPASQPVINVIEAPAPSHTEAAPAPVTSTTTAPKPTTPVQPRVVTPAGTIPPSLKSQIAAANPMTVSSKPLEAAAPAIEPVEVSEGAERVLLLQGPPPAYPPNAKGQQGNVILQVLIGRDGRVQDAKFMQGSLVFARSAIDAVRQWQFKPYLLNNRPVSVQTRMTIKFSPGQ